MAGVSPDVAGAAGIEDRRVSLPPLKEVPVVIDRLTVGGLILAASVALTGVTVPPAAAAPPPLTWTDCPVNETDAPPAQCATLQVPVDWNRPDGPTFGLKLARRTATDPQARVGSLVFGPGGPGDSGVDRIRTKFSRFSKDLQRRFDIVSFDPRGIGGSNPVVCSADLLARQPSPIITSQAEYDTTLAYNRELAKDCRAHTGPLYDHVDTLNSVKDLDAIRAALGESKLTFHGSSYGTLLGQQYAEAYPQKVRAIVLESVVDHSLGTREFLDTQAETAQDSFDEFMKWCDRTTACALHGRDIPALWADLLARAGRGELPDPLRPNTALTPFTLSFTAMKLLYDPEWARLAQAFGRSRDKRAAGADPREADWDRAELVRCVLPGLELARSQLPAVRRSRAQDCSYRPADEVPRCAAGDVLLPGSVLPGRQPAAPAEGAH